MGQRLVLPLHSERDHMRGSADAAVTLLEYGDYQCTICRAAHATVEAIRGHMGPDCMSGVQSGVTVTPTFFVNNVRLRGRFDVESLLVAIERAAGSYPLAR
jgi:protein-disulfide isomerase